MNFVVQEELEEFEHHFEQEVNTKDDDASIHESFKIELEQLKIKEFDPTKQSMSKAEHKVEEDEEPTLSCEQCSIELENHDKEEELTLEHPNR